MRACVPFAHSLFLVVANERGQETKKNSPTRFNCALHSIFPRHPPSSASGRVSTLFAASTRSCCAHRRSSHRCSSSQPPFSRRGQTHGRCAAVNDRACFFLGGWGGALFSCYSGCVRAYMHAACVCVFVWIAMRFRRETLCCDTDTKTRTSTRRHADTHAHTRAHPLVASHRAAVALNLGKLASICDSVAWHMKRLLTVSDQLHSGGRIPLRRIAFETCQVLLGGVALLCKVQQRERKCMRSCMWTSHGVA